MNPFLLLGIAIVVVAAVVYLITILAPGMDQRFRSALYVVAFLGLFFWALHLFGALPAGCARAVGR